MSKLQAATAPAVAAAQPDFDQCLRLDVSMKPELEAMIEEARWRPASKK